MSGHSEKKQMWRCILVALPTLNAALTFEGETSDSSTSGVQASSRVGSAPQKKKRSTQASVAHIVGKLQDLPEAVPSDLKTLSDFWTEPHQQSQPSKLYRALPSWPKGAVNMSGVGDVKRLPKKRKEKTAPFGVN
ncbi:MAG: hypothetical protein FRX49_03997 [Trebouxia sp. A1-2]|nr:MAG: hypothetical protein FRX49_03997 [Trebouxia sp. A1-2]